MAQFNIFSKLREEIDDFDRGGVYIVGKPKNDIEFTSRQDRRGEDGGYFYSQRGTLEAIDLACASKFKRGIRDKEGQKKTYMNIVNFYRDVTRMKIHLRMANYILEPRALEYVWPVYFMNREFRMWGEDESYDDLLSEYANDLSTYGSTVSKRLGDCPARVPLRTIRNTLTAKTLEEGARNGGYVIIENDLHYNTMNKYPAWNLDGVKKHTSHTIYERYGLVPRSLLANERWKTEQIVNEVTDDDEMVLVLAVLIPNDAMDKQKDLGDGGKIAFMEEISEEDWPLDECHINKRDGRWLGVGEVEKQLENQQARNLDVNLRRRGLLWAVKKIYQSTDDEVQKNLVMEVKDGDVLKVKPDGQISQVNTANQHTSDIGADEVVWEKNSQQVAFAFEAATGESMPSGTPFRLGLILDKAVSSHFEQMKQTYSNFLRRSFFNQVIPSFQEEYHEEHTMQMPITAGEIDNLKEAMINYHVNDRIFRAMVNKKPVVPEMIRMEVEEEMNRNMYLFINMPKGAYKDPQYYMRLNITEDIGPEIATLTTIWQDLNSKGDPRADYVLRQILAKQGKMYETVLGLPPRAAAPPQAPPGPPAPTPEPIAA